MNNGTLINQLNSDIGLIEPKTVFLCGYIEGNCASGQQVIFCYVTKTEETANAHILKFKDSPHKAFHKKYPFLA